jgi:hypothetical protein
MRDWNGSRVREDALKVPCRYCHVPAGELCVTRDDNPRPLQAFPAHACRIGDAQKSEEER